MISFLVTVLCLAHIKNCPIPNGYHATYQVTNKKVCEDTARTIVAQLGYATADFTISCKEK